MLSISELKVGTHIQIDNEPYVITWTQQVQMGRGGSILRTKMRNLISGALLEKTYKGAEGVKEADLSRTKAEYLYKDEYLAYFMESQNYEQFGIDLEVIGKKIQFLKEGIGVDVLSFNQKPVGVEIPIKIDLVVTSAPPAIKGDTAQGSVTKEIELESGASIRAPIFVKKGDVVRVNTERGEYVERV